MPRVVTMAFCAVLLAGLAIFARPPAAWAAIQDGNWSVLIITEKGDCDRAFRYAVTVAEGRVRYVGMAAVDVLGTVSARGLVKVSIRAGQRSARGTGRLSAQNGAGTWRGTAASGGICAGRWEAGRR